MERKSFTEVGASLIFNKNEIEEGISQLADIIIRKYKEFDSINLFIANKESILFALELFTKLNEKNKIRLNLVTVPLNRCDKDYFDKLKTICEGVIFNDSIFLLYRNILIIDILNKKDNFISNLIKFFIKNRYEKKNIKTAVLINEDTKKIINFSVFQHEYISRFKEEEGTKYGHKFFGFGMSHYPHYHFETDSNIYVIPTLKLILKDPNKNWRNHIVYGPNDIIPSKKDYGLLFE